MKERTAVKERTAMPTPPQLPAPTAAAAAADVDTEAPPETGIEKPRRFGLIIAFLVFGVFGVWAATAPIEGAAHATGAIAAKSRNRLAQHLEGGIVKEIRARDGDRVAAGDVLLVMDNTQPMAQLEISAARLSALLALEARLVAERDGLQAVAYPAALRRDAESRKEITAQNQVFRARRDARQGEAAVLQQRVVQLRSRIDGLMALRQAKTMLADSYAEELADVRSLLKDGYIEKQRAHEVERAFATAAAEAAELQANIAETEIQIGETELQIIQAANQFQAEVADQLAQTQTDIKDIRERIHALEDVVRRTEVIAPVAGIVLGMRAHTEGGVINAGAPIAEIVPTADELIIEARVSPADIDRVAPGQKATAQFSTFGDKGLVTAEAVVIHVSADAMADNGPQAQPYYLARVELTDQGKERLGDTPLVPGMPVEVFINSGSRTFLQYILKPVMTALSRSLRED